MPERFQLSRRKDWRLPPNTVGVARPGRFGNPFTIPLAIESGYAKPSAARLFVVECFSEWLLATQRGRDWWQGPESDARRKSIIDGLPSLRGKNLACWCALGTPCHAEALLRLANESSGP